MVDPAPLRLSATEELILDGLVSRFRLGETIWPFESRNSAALNRLESRGLINVMSGNVEGTKRASLADDALYEYGDQWFQIGATLRSVPESAVFPAWCREDVNKIEEVADFAEVIDPRSVNSAHLMTIQMIALHLPVFWFSALLNGSQLNHGTRFIEINPSGREYTLKDLTLPTVTTTNRSEVLRFAAQAGKGYSQK